jgi:uncharacterized RDD family membrane protein YckC
MQVNYYDFKNYAGFWHRLCAALIDGVVLTVILAAVSAIPYSGLLSALLVVAYLFGGSRWRVGYRILGIRMISIDGAEATLGQLVVRFLVSLLSVLALGLGYFWIAVDPNRQAWHDKIAGTYVIRQTAQPTRSASLSQAHPINWRFAIPCMLAVIGLPVAVAGGVFYWLASSDAYRVAKAYLEDHPAIIAKVGHSPEFGWLPSGKISKTSTGGQALLDVNVRGDVGELVARVSLVSQEGSWEVVEAGYYGANGQLVAIEPVD